MDKKYFTFVALVPLVVGVCLASDLPKPDFPDFISCTESKNHIAQMGAPIILDAERLNEKPSKYPYIFTHQGNGEYLSSRPDNFYHDIGVPVPNPSKMSKFDLAMAKHTGEVIEVASTYYSLELTAQVNGMRQWAIRLDTAHFIASDFGSFRSVLTIGSCQIVSTGALKSNHPKGEK